MESKENKMTIRQWLSTTLVVYGAWCVFNSAYVSVGGVALCWGYVDRLPFIYLEPHEAERCFYTIQQQED